MDKRTAASTEATLTVVAIYTTAATKQDTIITWPIKMLLREPMAATSGSYIMTVADMPCLKKPTQHPEKNPQLPCGVMNFPEENYHVITGTEK